MFKLIQKKYTRADGMVICFGAAPGAAFFYGFLFLAGSILVPFQALTAARFIDSALAAINRGESLTPVYQSLIILMTLTAFQWLKLAIHNFADLKLVLALRKHYRIPLIEKCSRLEYTHLENPDARDLIHRITGWSKGNVVKDSYFHVIDLIGFVLKVGGLLLILSRAVWWGGLAVIAVSALTLITGIKGGKLLHEADRKASEYERRTEYLGSLLTGRKTAAERTLFGYTSRLNARWEDAHCASFIIKLKARLKWFINAYTGNIISQAAWIFSMVILLGPLKEGVVTLGLFIALTQALTGLDIVWGFMETVNSLSRESEFYKDLTSFSRLSEAITPAGRSLSLPLPEYRSLSIENLSFAYPGTDFDGRDAAVLRNFTYTFEAGTRYAIVGANGAGKTTLVKLITGLYRSDAGAVRLNGIPLENTHGNEITAVYQDFARYDLTLKENILLGKEDISPKRLEQVMVDTGLDRIAANLPRGLDTPLGRLDEGADLSGGEWQRVAMARALVSPAPLILLDEPAASLDPLAESRLYELFSTITAGRSTILITHRLGAAATADQIILIDQGKPVESGSHEELMKSQGLYQRMFESQRSWYEIG